MAYQPGIPTGTVNLDVDYQNIQGNFGQLETTIGKDHLPPSNGTAQNGYHTSIHMVPQGGIVNTSGFAQVYSQTVAGGDQALFINTGTLNQTAQLTVPMVPVAASNGYTFLPGGFILQWGLVNGTHGVDLHFNGGDTGAVTFATNNIAFPTSCYGIWTQPMFTNGTAPTSPNTATVAINRSFSNTSFIYAFMTNSSAYTRFFWYAIGK